jgi:hypothetical protein
MPESAPKRSVRGTYAASTWTSRIGVRTNGNGNGGGNGDQCHSGEGDFGEVERTRLITIAYVLLAFALDSFIGSRSRRASSAST